MKYQAILLTLLQAQHALSKGGAASRPLLAAASFSDCVTWCHSEVGSTSPALPECIVKHCHHEDADGPGITANNVANDATKLKLEEEGRGDQTPAECAAGCRRLRFSPDRVRQCVDNCGVDEDNGPANAKRSDPPSSESDAGGWNRNRSDAEAWDRHRNSGNGGRRRRSREARRNRRSAQNKNSNPPAPERRANLPGSSDSSSPRYELPGNDTSCVRRCRNLRMSVHRQETCVKECDALEGSGERSDFGAVGEEKNKKNKRRDDPDRPGVPGNDNACLRRCRNLRMSVRRQETCIKECNGALEEPGERSDFDAVGEEKNKKNKRRDDPDRPSIPGNDDACLRRCRNLRMSVRRQEVCIKECNAGEGTGEEFESRLRRRSGVHHGRNHSSQEKFLNIAANDDPPGRDSACVALCKRRRFGPARQAVCIEGCHQEEMDGDDYYNDDDMSMSMSTSMNTADGGGHERGNPTLYGQDKDQQLARIS